MEEVPLLDLRRQYESIKDEIKGAIDEVLESQRFILGMKVSTLEEKIATLCNCKYAIGVSSGTDAILLSLMAEDIGVGDEVITTPYTFFATAGSISRTGAKPVFVDINPNSYNINPNLIEDAITHRTKAIIPVHLFGQCVEMDQIMEVSKKHNLIVIEDAAQAIGAKYPENGNSKRAGSMGDYGCFSFFPSKNLGCYGDGGMIVTNSSEKSDKVRMMRSHGSKPKYYHKFIGGNFRLDSIQAAILLVKLKYLSDWTAKRQINSNQYQKLFESYGLLKNDCIKIPEVTLKGNLLYHIYNQYIIRVKDRDELKGYLTSEGISTEIYYPIPLHLQECFSDLGYTEGDFLESEKASKETLALPIYPELTKEQLEYVVHTIADFYK